MKLKEGNTYIVCSAFIEGDYQKIKILEVTRTSYYIHNLDYETKYRISRKKFHFECRIVETIENMEQKPSNTKEAKEQ